jgi:AraC-like DNA-binding protein
MIDRQSLGMPGSTQVVEYEAPPGQWRFSSAASDHDLAGIVVEYWEVEGRLSPFRERVLPNGCTEVMINLGPPHRMRVRGGSSLWETAWFSGLHARSISIESLSGTHLVSARLHPLGALQLFGAPVAGLVNTVVDLETLVGASARELRASLLKAGSAQERFGIIEGFLRTHLSRHPVPTGVTRAAAQLIEEVHGDLRISSLHGSLGISRKHLWHHFARELGMSPKGYAGLHRFVWTLARLRESTGVDWPRLAIAAGYSDQSHLVRDFRRVASASPTEFLRTRSPDTTALLDPPG